MTLQQTLAFLLLGGAIAVFIWGRFRYDLVALVTLLVGLLIGVVPANKAFSGFSNEIVVIIGSALVVSAAVSRSGIIEVLMRPVLNRLRSEQAQVPALVGATTLLSMVTKNVGALAIFMPLAINLARREKRSASPLLMPMAAGSMLGGVVTLVGTAPNIIVAELRAEVLGKPFGMFDYTPVGLCLAVGGVIFLSFAYRLLPRDRKGAATVDEALESAPYVTEASAPEDWPLAGKSVYELHDLSSRNVRVLAIVRGEDRYSAPLPDTEVQPGDTLVMQGDQKSLDRLIADAQLKLGRTDAALVKEDADDEAAVAEAVVGARSILAGRSAREVGLYERYGVNLIAVGRSDEKITQRPSALNLHAGDVIVLKGASRLMPGVLRDLGCLPLAERELRLGAVHRKLLPILILAAAMVLVALKVATVGVAFFAAAVLMVVTGALSLRDAYRSLDGPLLILIAALIPVSDAIRVSGGTELIAGQLAGLVQGMPVVLGVGLTMMVAMIATPFLNNAATVLVLGPIGLSLAKLLGHDPDPFLMAVAVGAACDFLTPIGHQCNTLVMGPGGYRFGDYARLGTPLSIFVLLAGPPLILFFWPA